MKLLHMCSAWLGFTLVLSTLAHAQPPSAPPLKPNEKIVQTKDGCGIVIDGSARYADHEATRISELTWSGPCIGGLAMGEGWVSEGEYRYVDFPPVRGWAWYGRRFGVMETRQANGSISFHQLIWDGKHVSYNTLSTAKPTWPGAGVSFPSQVADTEISVSVSRKLQFDRSYLYSVSSHDRRSGSNMEYKCPNPHSSEGCDALWAEHAGPVIDRIKAFIAENKPKADALKRQIAPLIAHWRPSPNAKRDDASRHAALREQHLAERAKREADLAQAKRENERFEREYQQRQAEQQAKDEKLKAEAERERNESQRRDQQEAMALLRGALSAAAGGQNSAERKKLALESLSQGGGGTGTTPSPQVRTPASPPAESNSQAVSSTSTASKGKSLDTEFPNSKWCTKVFTVSDVPERFSANGVWLGSRKIAFGVKNECDHPVYIYVRANETGPKGCETWTGLDYEFAHDHRLQQTIDKRDGTAVVNHGKYYRPGEETRTKPISLRDQRQCNGWEVIVLSACATEEEMARKLGKFIVKVSPKESYSKNPNSNCVATEYFSPYVPAAK